MSVTLFRPRRRRLRGAVFRALDLMAALIIIAAASGIVASLLHS